MNSISGAKSVSRVQKCKSTRATRRARARVGKTTFRGKNNPKILSLFVTKMFLQGKGERSFYPADEWSF